MPFLNELSHSNELSCIWKLLQCRFISFYDFSNYLMKQSSYLYWKVDKYFCPWSYVSITCFIFNHFLCHLCHFPSFFVIFCIKRLIPFFVISKYLKDELFIYIFHVLKQISDSLCVFFSNFPVILFWWWLFVIFYSFDYKESSCKYVTMQLCHDASMLSCKYVIMQVYHHASMSSCKYVIVQVCHRASISSCKYVSKQVCQHASMSARK